MEKIKNPQKECKETPKEFSETSQIIRVEKEEFESGIILDSPEEFVNALVVYNNGSVRDSEATEDNLMKSAVEDYGPLAGGLIASVGEMKGPGIMEQLKKDALLKLKKDGRFHKDFEYDGLGTRFFKTGITGEKIGNKYVLELCAAYVGNKPEENLAKTLGKQRALLNSRTKGILSIVDDWWFNVNLQDTLKKLPISKKELGNAKEWAKYISSSGFKGKQPEIKIKYDSKGLMLKVGLDAFTYLKPEGASYDNCYIEARGNSIVGPAWTIFGDERKIDPKPREPAIVLSLSLPGWGIPAVTKKERDLLYGARDHISNTVFSKN